MIGSFRRRPRSAIVISGLDGGTQFRGRTGLTGLGEGEKAASSSDAVVDLETFIRSGLGGYIGLGDNRSFIDRTGALIKSRDIFQLSTRIQNPIRIRVGTP